jgi:glycosyltransferase involved in cell wall biosynthesis
MKVDITIPILNEADTLDRQVRTVLNFLEDPSLQAYELNIVIADNGSTDASPDIARGLAAEFGRVSYVRLEERGVGRALKRSWCESQTDVVGYMDLDLATDLRHLPAALNAIRVDGYDVVTGTRLARKSKVIGRSALRALTSRVFNQMLRTYLSVSFSDGMCGFKFLKRSNLAMIREAGANSDGWFFATEILTCAEWLGLRIYDLPVTWTDDPNSKAKVGKLAVEYTKAMRELRSRLKKQSRETILDSHQNS